MDLIKQLLKEAKINPPVQPNKKEPAMRDEYDAPLGVGGPAYRVKTGLSSEDGATELEIYYVKDRTYVVPIGEEFNADPWSYKGYFNKEDVKRWYVKSIQDYM